MRAERATLPGDPTGRPYPGAGLSLRGGSQDPGLCLLDSHFQVSLCLLGLSLAWNPETTPGFRSHA